MLKLIVVWLIPLMLIMFAGIQTGCAVDTALRQVDRLCDAETKTKAEYRACLKDQYDGIKDAVRPPKTEGVPGVAKADKDGDDEDDAEEE